MVADGTLIVYNPDDRGSKLYRFDPAATKRKLRLIAEDIAVADVDGNRILGWRGSRTLVTLRPDGHILAKTAVARSATTSVVLDRAWLFTTAGDRLTRRTVNGARKRSWQLIDDGGPKPTLTGVSGNLAVYVSGVAVHVLQLDTGHDVELELPNPGASIDTELTDAGLFYTYNAAYTSRPGRVGFIDRQDLAAAFGSS